MSSTPRTPLSPTSTATATGVEGTPRRRAPPLPAVKGTLAGIESPRRDREIYSPAPASVLRASRAPSTEANAEDVAQVDIPPQPTLVFRSDPRLKTCFDSLPEGSEEIKAKFRV